jgi:type I restriction enzyme, S subunit
MSARFLPLAADSEPPEGWALTSIGDITQIKYGRGLKESDRAAGSVAVYGSNGVVGFHNIALTKGLTIIIGRKGSVGKVHVSSSPCWPIDTTYFIDDFLGLDPEFLAHALRLLRLNELDTSTAIPGLNRDDVYSQKFRLPPLAEQNRIVHQTEKLLARTNSARERLGHASAIVKRFRQAVLDAAVCGRLTKNWRDTRESGASGVDDLKTMLASTERERRPRSEDTSTENYEILAEMLPDTWGTARLGDVFRFLDYRGKTPKKSKSGHRLISAKNVKMGYLSDEPVEYLSDTAYLAWMTRGFPNPGDILFVTEGHTMGFAAINNRQDEFALSQRTITLQPWGRIENRCFFYFIMSSVFQNLVRLNATGSAAVGIKGATLQTLPIPFPSLREQSELAQRVESLFQLADDIEKRVESATTRTEKLAQAILAKALTGELVPAEAELARREGRAYESASDLLARIRSERPVSIQRDGVGRKKGKWQSRTLAKTDSVPR